MHCLPVAGRGNPKGRWAQHADQPCPSRDRSSIIKAKKRSSVDGGESLAGGKAPGPLQKTMGERERQGLYVELMLNYFIAFEE